MKRMLIAGAAGQLGRAIVAECVGAAGGGGRIEAVAAGSAEMDVTDPDSVRAALDRVRPDAVVNCAAFTAVDAAESDEAAAGAVNADGAGHVAAACAPRGIGLIHISTDYVFSGDPPADPPFSAAPAGSAAPGGSAGRRHPFEGREPGDPTAPKTAYGRTKLAGERAVLAAHAGAVVVRTAWVYTGTAPSGRGGDFVTTMRRLAETRDHVDVVSDQHGSPTYAPDLAAGIVALTGRVAGAAGGPAAGGRRILHAAGGGEATWYDLARGVFEELGADPRRVRPCTTEAMPRPAPRPAYSVLSGRSWSAAGLTALRHWRPALTDALREHP